MADPLRNAPGGPGMPPRWTSSAKSGVGTSLRDSSKIWFTLSHGICNEIYFPRIDQACTRDMGLIVTNGVDFFSEEKRHADSEINPLAEGVPAFRLTNTCREGRYRIEKTILNDPRWDVLLQEIRFIPLREKLGDYHLFVLLAPHLGNRGYENTAWVDDYKGLPMLFAQRGATALAFASSPPFIKRSVGFVGASDGWQDLSRHKKMTWIYDRAENGNVAMTAEVDLQTYGGKLLLALGFGHTPAAAAHYVRASLTSGFEEAKEKFIKEWRDWQENLPPMDNSPRQHRLYASSKTVLRVHESKNFPGGVIASLSIPWGFSKGDEDIGGYHLVWPRDLVEAAGGLLACGATKDARRVLNYLHVTQEADGHWPLNMWLDGSVYWKGIEMDEMALPILLVDLAKRQGVLQCNELADLWPMIRRAASFIVQNGPVTQEDRWEKKSGYSPFTLSTLVAALLVASEMADLNQESEVAVYLRETADNWNENIETWTYVTDTNLAHRMEVEGYYIRIAPPERKGYHLTPEWAGASEVVSPDALALVRFGLRAPNDPRVVNTVQVIDRLLKVNTPHGPSWHRFNGDLYGEYDDGSPFDGSGKGRVWPLLTGERAHYELAAGKEEEAVKLRQTIEAFSNEGMLISEQIWDGPDLPERGLFYGRPSGSAMPLVWAHAEYIKLCRSLMDGRVFDRPPQPVKRYIVEKTGSPFRIWSIGHPCRTLPAGAILRIQLHSPARVHWSVDDWVTSHDDPTRDTGLGIYLFDLPRKEFHPGIKIVFTFYWPETHRWEGENFFVIVE